MEIINEILAQLKLFPISLIHNGFKINHADKKLTELCFRIDVEKLIFPLREGEFIKDIYHLNKNEIYSLSYPGTASTKSMVLFSPAGGGIFIGGVPTYEWAKIKIRRIEDKTIEISYYSLEHKLYFIPFRINWRLAADQYKKLIKAEEYLVIKRKPKYFLQIGIKNSQEKCDIDNFSELRPLIDYFTSEMGPGHIIHFFGTNYAGFDRMAPDYKIDQALGGEEALAKLVKYIKKQGHLSSHHYNPRIADSDWLKQHQEFRPGIVRKKDNSYVCELYKGHKHFFMNPNNELWFNRSMETVKYLRNIGFDYIQLDQFTYQRNFYNPHKPLQLGYKKMTEEFERLGIKYWLEGVSDIHKLKKGNFYQILTRDIPQVWEDNESRRGYPHGVSYSAFFMYLYPNAEVSYQLITEKNCLSDFGRRLKIARRINAAIYDLQMTFYDKKNYLILLKKIIAKIHEYGAKNG
ncbi:DUF6259 domain-containing protein [bacterium]|nr:DUF6259 domain-containing protein [bacterium]